MTSQRAAVKNPKKATLTFQQIWKLHCPSPAKKQQALAKGSSVSASAYQDQTTSFYYSCSQLASSFPFLSFHVSANPLSIERGEWTQKQSACLVLGRFCAMKCSSGAWRAVASQDIELVCEILNFYTTSGAHSIVVFCIVLASFHLSRGSIVVFTTWGCLCQNMGYLVPQQKAILTGCMKLWDAHLQCSFPILGDSTHHWVAAIAPTLVSHAMSFCPVTIVATLQCLRSVLAKVLC